MPVPGVLAPMNTCPGFPLVTLAAGVCSCDDDEAPAPASIFAFALGLEPGAAFMLFVAVVGAPMESRSRFIDHMFPGSMAVLFAM